MLKFHLKFHPTTREDVEALRLDINLWVWADLRGL